VLSLLIPPIAGVVALVFYAAKVAGLSAFALALLTALGAGVAGGLLGFLFGIPRTITAGTSGSADAASGWFRSSTSLEEIADWLTKILVGLGLASLGRLVRQIGNLIDFLAPALGPAGEQVAFGVLTLFSVSGFLIFYLTTRIYFAPAFAYAEEQLRGKILAEDAVTTLKAEPPATAEFLDALRAEQSGRGAGNDERDGPGG
jgi:hypothetical protein